MDSQRVIIQSLKVDMASGWHNYDKLSFFCESKGAVTNFAARNEKVVLKV